MTCAKPIDGETLVSYWAGDLAHTDEEALEAHLMGCAECTRESARVAAITEGLRGMLPPIVSPELIGELRARGLRVDERPTVPGGRTDVVFTREVDVIILRLGGLRLERAARVDFAIRTTDDAARLLLRTEGVPFNRAGGEVLLACQRHYDVYPQSLRAEVRVVDENGGATTTEFTLDHRFE